MSKKGQRDPDLLKSRDILINSLIRNKAYVFKNSLSMTMSELETRLSLIESIFSQLCSIQTAVEQGSVEETEPDKRQRFEEAYCEVKSKILSEIAQNRRRSSNIPDNGVLNQTVNTSGIVGGRCANLPKLKLPLFTGKYTDWTNWFNTFRSMVDSDCELDELSKFVHLRSCLGPVPLSTIEFLELTGVNYPKALELLRKRFENKSVIFQSHVKELFELERILQPSSASLRRLIDIVNSHLHSLESLGSESELKDVLLFYLVSLKLDDETLSKWHEDAKVRELPTWKNLENFLSNRCLSLENFEFNQKRVDNKVNKTASSKISRHNPNSKVLAATTSQSKSPCPCCGEGHQLIRCQKFLNLSPKQRYFEAKKDSLCILCLEGKHPVKDCNAVKCECCHKPHHKLLHRESAKPERPKHSHDSESCRLLDNSTLYSSMLSVSAMNFLATAVILIKDASGKFHEIRCILDSGSQLNFITSRFAAQLKLPPTKAPIVVNGIGRAKLNILETVNSLIKSKVTNYCCNLELHVIPEITSYSPNQSVNIDDWKLPKNIKLADPLFYESGTVDMLIGVGLFFNLMAVGQIKLADNLPRLQKSLFGWLVVGECSSSSTNSLNVVMENNGEEDTGKLMKLLEKFWTYEDISHDTIKPLSCEERRCEEHFLSTLTRTSGGRFIVRLPFREDSCSLGGSYSIALRRFLNLERRLDANPDLKREYANFIEEYESMGHLENVTMVSKLDSGKYFMPHHPVLRLESSSTKLRVVFDASCKSDNGLSLNDILLVGPRLQPELFDILVRFRFYRYAITADIRKMYRQVMVHKDDCLYQCILWRPDKTEAVQILRLKTVTYGTSSAPFLAVRCLSYLAETCGEDYPIGSRIILENFYMDDMLAGANSKEELFRLKMEVPSLLDKGKFELHKWRSSCAELNSTDDALCIKTEDCAKTLGILWDSAKDVFRFSFGGSNCDKVTKRNVLSDLARIFDPLGLINPVVVLGKIFMQELWLLKLEWDETLPQSLSTQWNRFREDWSLLKEFVYPRTFWKDDNIISVELHGFSDASNRAYGAIVYVRILDDKGIVNVELICAKSRVAPLKSLSIPRLELLGACLLVQLMERVKNCSSMKIDDVFYWTDSTIVLQWIASHPSRWSTFIANRVAKIQNLTKVSTWYKVDGKENPADIVSRGMYPSELLKCTLWFKGPTFLLCPTNEWRMSVIHSCDVTKEMEERRSAFSLPATHFQSSFIDLVSTCKFVNNFLKLQRVFAYIYRWRRILSRVTKVKHTPYLTVLELNGGLNYIIFNIQNVIFYKEIQSLSVDRNISLSSVQKLNPFIDTSSIPLLRVGGRLENARIPFAVKHPILLPNNHIAVFSLATYIHNINSHAGAQALAAFVRQRFWIINLRKVARKVVRQCIPCFKHKPKPLIQLMGDLPSFRVNGNYHTFERTGMDFAGPIAVHFKIRGKRPYKAYLAIFVCFLTKACHIEVVSDLSTSSFIASLKRFFSRRGLSSDLFCDNGTNFVGAARELREVLNTVFTNASKTTINNELAALGVKFHFIPPRSPHFGGLWESAIKVAKQMLLHHITSTSLTFEELCTVVSQIEAIMNSRPLCPLSTDPNDLEALTPGHFLIGRPLNSFPDAVSDNDFSMSHVNRWKRIQAIQMMFWKRWSREYLTLLQERLKWTKIFKNIEIGTLVLISEDNVPPSHWLLGRVTEVHSGVDGIVRVVTLRTKSGILKRSIHRICPLPLE